MLTYNTDVDKDLYSGIYKFSITKNNGDEH